MACLFVPPQLLGHCPAHSRCSKTFVEGMNDYFKARGWTPAKGEYGLEAGDRGRNSDLGSMPGIQLSKLEHRPR